eukprot:9086525-Alexandrium_andersonii.AAC.1
MHTRTRARRCSRRFCTAVDSRAPKQEQGEVARLCAGLPGAWRPLAEDAKGHRLIVLSQDDLQPVLMCTSCGSWAMKRLVKLARPFEGSANS